MEAVQTVTTHIGGLRIASSTPHVTIGASVATCFHVRDWCMAEVRSKYDLADKSMVKQPVSDSC